VSAPFGPVVVAARRSAIGTAGHAFAGVGAADLAAPVVAAAASDATAVLGEAGADDARVEEVLLGNCMGPGGNVARVATLLAGLGDRVPAATVDRQCASGLSAVVSAVAEVGRGAGLVLAGGVESASTAPWRHFPPSDGAEPLRYERAPFAPAGRDPDMGLANDLYAERAGVTREQQDEYAARSHVRAHATREAGGFDAEIVPVSGVRHDERPRRGMTAARLGRLPATFREGGTVTAGNACGINDGAAVVAVVDGARGHPLPGLRVLASAVAAGDPTNPGQALVPAARQALERAGLGWRDVDVVELNEAFAGQVVACCGELGIDPGRVCPEGGALGLGHPWGASGAVLVVRLFSQLVRSGRGGTGLAAIAAGGGQGVALVVEATG
jgi:acetyl-CoA C-acetyltransferase